MDSIDRGLILALIASLILVAWIELCRIIDKRRARKQRIDIYEEMSLMADDDAF